MKQGGKTAPRLVAIAAISVATFGGWFQMRTAEAADTTAYKKGLELYGQKNYRQAAQEFERQLQITAADPNALYYCALCHQLSSNRSRAKQLYEYITKNFPGTGVARNAGTALGQLSVLGASTPGAGGSSFRGEGASASTRSSGNSSSLSGIPDEVRIPFERQGNHVVVEVNVNGHGMAMILDTGAEMTVMGRNHLEEAGISRTDSRDSFEVVGVGDRKGVKAFNDKFDLKLGPIYRRDFTCAIQDSMPTPPLLGMTFLADFVVTVDDASHSVILRKKGSMAASDASRGRSGAIAVPFELDGRSIMVNTKVNGKPYKMNFDTGASHVCFSRGDWKKLGFDIPSDARVGTSSGIAGDVKSYTFTLDSLVLPGEKAGSIKASNVPVTVTESERPCALLGQPFYINYRYEVDNAKRVIYFTEQK